ASPVCMLVELPIHSACALAPSDRRDQPEDYARVLADHLQGRCEVGIVAHDDDLVYLIQDGVAEGVQCQRYVGLLLLQFPDLDDGRLTSGFARHADVRTGGACLVVAGDDLDLVANVTTERSVILRLTRY